jgi:hypothetical protein
MSALSLGAMVIVGPLMGGGQVAVWGGMGALMGGDADVCGMGASMLAVDVDACGFGTLGGIGRMDGCGAADGAVTLVGSLGGLSGSALGGSDEVACSAFGGLSVSGGSDQVVGRWAGCSGIPRVDSASDA